MTMSATSPLGQRAASPRAAQLWKAYSRSYSLAGRWHTARVLGTVGLALVAPIISFALPGTTTALAVAAGVWLLIARACLGPAEDWERRRGVNTQEMFDTFVFELPWNVGACGRPNGEEDIAKAAAKYGRPAPSDWYADTQELPKPLDVILCQRSSAAWGRKTHLAYAVVLAVLGVIVFVAGVLFGLFGSDNLSSYLLGIFLPTVPALLDTIDMSLSHQAASRRKAQIEHAADGHWAAGIRSLSGVTLGDCRQLQDQSCRLRADCPRVPSWLYHLRHDGDERAMREAADQRIAEYRASRPT